MISNCEKAKTYRILMVALLAALCQACVILDPARGGAGGPAWLQMMRFRHEILFACLICLIIWLALQWGKERADAFPVLAGITTTAIAIGFFASITAAGVYKLGGNTFLRDYFCSLQDERFPLLAVAGLSAAAWEEAFFRGTLQSWLEKKTNTFVALALVALLFSVFHSNPDASLYLAAVSFGVSYAISKSLFGCFLAHALYNLVAVFGRLAADIGASSYTDHQKLAAALILYSYMICIPISLLLGAVAHKYAKARTM